MLSDKSEEIRYSKGTFYNTSDHDHSIGFGKYAFRSVPSTMASDTASMENR
jgi:hypothetical protein